MNESNALLADQFEQCDETAFAKLMGRHHSLVFRVCLRILGHRQDAEDATQETFSRLARYLNRWDRRQPLEPWLVTIAGNRCRTLLASKRSHQPLSLSLEPSVDGAAQQQAAETLREEVQLALCRLPPGQRRAFELFHEQSLSYAEIAQQLDCPLGTVKTWVHRARVQMIEHLRARDVIEAARPTLTAQSVGSEAMP